MSEPNRAVEMPKKEQAWSVGLGRIENTHNELAEAIAGLGSEIAFLFCEEALDAPVDAASELPGNSALNKGLRGAHRHAEELLSAVRVIRSRLEP